MGKRTNFPPAPRDFWPTPLKAVQPLIPHLDGIRRVAEPCAGEGDLVQHLESFGLCCTYQGDIATGQDALDLTSDDIADSPIITNPPFSKKSQPLLRRMLVHFPRISPATWLLLPADFASNQWFADFLPSCTDIVAIGRVKGTKGAGFASARVIRLGQSSTPTARPLQGCQKLAGANNAPDPTDPCGQIPASAVPPADNKPTASELAVTQP